MAATYCDRLVVMQQGQVVETAPVRDLFVRPTHPYTKKLIAASPGPDSVLADLTATPDELANAPVPVEPLQRPIPLATSNTLMEVIDLVKVFPRRGRKGRTWPWSKPDSEASVFRAVDDVSFTLKRGESLGLVGESGCGKSTTSSIVTRLLDPTSGDVIFDGENITIYRADRFARLPQRRKIQNVVRLLCDRVIVMNQGRIVETGAVDQVFDHPEQPYTKTLIEAIPHFEPGRR